VLSDRSKKKIGYAYPIFWETLYVGFLSVNSCPVEFYGNGPVLVDHIPPTVAVLFANGGESLCQVDPADCRRYHIRSPNCIFDISKIAAVHVSNPPPWGVRRGKRSENRQRKSSDLGLGGDPAGTSRQRRIAVYNHKAQRYFKRPWQAELLNNPRIVRWARRKRQSL